MGQGYHIFLDRLLDHDHKLAQDPALYSASLPLKTGRKSPTTVPLSVSIYGRGVVYPPGQITGSFVESWLKSQPYIGEGLDDAYRACRPW